MKRRDFMKNLGLGATTLSFGSLRNNFISIFCYCFFQIATIS